MITLKLVIFVGFERHRNEALWFSSDGFARFAAAGT